MEKEEKKPLIILTGPTAVGKTAASIGLAKAIGGEIISADSMEVYKYMDIGSAKIRPEEMQHVPHYLVDELEPDDEFHVVRFQQMAKEAMEKIYDKGRIPILVGGTGFYIQAVTRDIDFTEAQQENTYRAELEKLAETEGAEYLHDRLKEVDPASADTIHANNVKRGIRALEYYRQTGKPISQHNEEQRQKESPYNLAYFVLNDERTHLYERIDARIDQMLAEKFGMEYVDKDGTKKNPYIIHRTSIGCYERTLAYLIEKYAGAFPTWLAPVQVKLLPIADRHLDYLYDVKKALEAKGIRCEIDDRSEKIGFKIRQAQLEKVPYMLLAGDKDIENNTVSLRTRSGGDKGAMSLDEFVDKLLKEVDDKSLELTM